MPAERMPARPSLSGIERGLSLTETFPVIARPVFPTARCIGEMTRVHFHAYFTIPGEMTEAGISIYSRRVICRTDVRPFRQPPWQCY